MSISQNLASELVATLSKETNSNGSDLLYGTGRKKDGHSYVVIDGSTYATPADATVEFDDGDRVTLTIKNHRATITGNVSNVAGRLVDTEKAVGNFSSNLDEELGSGKKPIDGSCIQSGTIPTERIDVDSIFARDIHLSNSFQLNNDKWNIVENDDGVTFETADTITYLESGEPEVFPKVEMRLTGGAEGEDPEFHIRLYKPTFHGLRCNEISLTRTSMNLQCDGNVIAVGTDDNEAGIMLRPSPWNPTVIVKDGSLYSSNIPSITEQGSNGIWNYIKYDDGFAECWGTYVLENPIACTTALGSALFRTSAIRIPDFPFEFISAPDTISSYSPSTDGVGAMLWVHTPNTVVRPGSVMLVRPTSAASLSGGIAFIARGHWK